MNKGLISVRYATALLQFAQDKNVEDEIYEQAKFLSSVFLKVSSLHAVLNSPMVPKSRKREIILTAAGEKTSDVFEKNIDMLLLNNREDCLQSIMLEYQEQYRKSKNILRGKLITAVEIDKPTTQSLIASIEGKVKGNLELEKIIDPKILGGFILEVDFYRWDASLMGQLNRIKKQYIERNRRIV
ncbi:MAG: F0F1 ATP synthase subunit delta [Dysgonamonadaceae bacterium]|jgi:F-type H+-transporting ATPase subunit delta|nr:F0F1 ATP synthase subunit delta [Dysgonamonadaceae bacterium]MDD3355536.1 F0F1 ATP synthase subunit delta [Dysgonamonadaceae bacterium]MDD3727703.1 F0F1 ATP synthase subunit delta [Dysgonamonadaceae bacterium]MDD4246247.1 F0F1 ATP synthase subunit delta [Dysgonamonadaceae bacterium]MDD4605148.1 F0F1 ATP synthase subunit delta [Dysgonamonadaceae bacterium]